MYRLCTGRGNFIKSLIFQGNDFQEENQKVIGNVMRNDCCFRIPAYIYSLK